MDIKKVAEFGLKSVVSGETTTLGKLWTNETCVVIFFRRWGCMFCRLWAKEVSEISTILEKNNVKLIGVGPEELGKEEFLEGKFFNGDLYTVAEKSSYNFLGFKRFSYLSVMAALLWKESRDGYTKAKALNVGGNMKGDGLQNGGLLIVNKNGELVKHFVQNGPAEHLSNAAILEALQISDPSIKSQPEVTKMQGECKLP